MNAAQNIAKALEAAPAGVTAEVVRYSLGNLAVEYRLGDRLSVVDHIDNAFLSEHLYSVGSLAA